MLQKLKITLLIAVIIGAVFDGSYWAYCKFGADIASSNIVKQLGGE